MLKLLKDISYKKNLIRVDVTFEEVTEDRYLLKSVICQGKGSSTSLCEVEEALKTCQHLDGSWITWD